MSADDVAEEIDLVGDEGLKTTEGVVTDINRRKKEITVTHANGKTETLQMTDLAATESEADSETSSDEASHIVIYYVDESGHKVAHFFKKGS